MTQNSTPQKVTYDLIQSQFEGINLAEAHGLLLAILCSNSLDHFAEWLEELNHLSVESAPLNEDILRIIYDKTLEEVESIEFSLRPLLPDENDFLGRVEGFIKWSHGFSYGFGLSGELYDKLDEDGTEYIQQLLEFSMLDPILLADGIQDSEEEIALEELIEFMRVGALMLFYQLREKPTIH